MKGFKKKIMTMALSVIMVVSMFGNVVSAGVSLDGNYEVTYGKNTFTVEDGKYNYYVYEPSKSGTQSITAKVPEGYLATIFLYSQGGMYLSSTPAMEEVYTNITVASGKAVYFDVRVYKPGKLYNDVLAPLEEEEVELTVTIGEAKDSILVVDSLDDGFKYVGSNNVKGLSWDYKNSTLTMDGFNAENEYITIYNSEIITKDYYKAIEGEIGGLTSVESTLNQNNVALNEVKPTIKPSEYEGPTKDVTVYVKGVNTLKNCGIYAGAGVNLIFKGDGELNFTNKSEKDGYFDVGQIIDFASTGFIYDPENDELIGGYNYPGTLTFDGPQVNINACTLGDIMFAPNFEMKSGTLYLEISPYEVTKTSSDVVAGHYGDIYAYNVKITGGDIVVKYAGLPEGLTYDSYSYSGEEGSRYCYHIFEASDVLVENATVIVTGDKETAESLGEPLILGYGEDGKLNIADTATYLIGNPIDISKLKVELSETSYNYDGTAKTPSVKVAGLKEGIDFEVAYKNNVEIGTATVTVKGKGCFSGSVDATFEIKGAVADGPKKGSTIKDKKYIYKVTKAGSKDGSIVGELKVTGLKKKSLTQIKIAAKVKIGGVTYKVTSVGSKAFKGNKKITKVFVGKNVKSIGANAFAKCTKLKQASINSKVLTSIGKNAFNGDKKLKKIIVKSTKLKKVGKKALAGTSKKLVVKVPKAKKKAYTKLFNKAGNKKVKVK